MKASSEISLSAKELEIVKTNDENAIKEVFENYLSDIESLLNRYDHYAGTHGDICNAEIVEVFTGDDLGINVNYEVFYYFGCADQDTTSEEYMTIDIVVDYKNQTATLTGEDRAEREPDEY